MCGRENNRAKDIVKASKKVKEMGAHYDSQQEVQNQKEEHHQVQNNKSLFR
jgi:hypothetical protein